MRTGLRWAHGDSQFVVPPVTFQALAFAPGLILGGVIGKVASVGSVPLHRDFHLLGKRQNSSFYEKDLGRGVFYSTP